MKFYIINCLVGMSLVHAIETDQFAAWTYELKDSSQQLEMYLQNSIIKTLNSTNNLGQVPKDCRIVVQRISDDLSSTSTPFVTNTEHWLMNSKSVDTHSVANTRWESVNQSIYNGYWRFKFLPFASTVNLYGVYLGVDKVGHFVEIGMDYYDILLTNLENGIPYSKSVNRAIDHGIFLENTIYGTMAAKIFSFGDLEANYQGMKWFESLCTSGSHAHLVRDETAKKWKLANAEKLSLKDYINPFWDESYNLNYYTPGMWDRVRSDLLYKCLELELPVVERRFTHYEKIKKSSQWSYIDQLEKTDQVPKRDFKLMLDFCFE